MATEASQELAFQQVKTRRVFEEICDQIRRRLEVGVLKPGDKLPAERDLALEFKVSRPAVREALRTLEISGVVSLQKGVKGGAFIRDGNPQLLTQSLQDLMFLGKVSLRSLAETRVLLNGLVIKLACERASEDDFRAIEDNIGFIESSEDLAHRAEAGVQFFRLIARATGNEVLTMLVDSLGDIIRYVIDKTGRVARPELVPVRRRILKAMRARDVAAATAAMDEYLAIVHEGMDAEPIALERPGRAPAAGPGKAPAPRPVARPAAQVVVRAIAR
jgi:DNA-binding FadR family transcriptional regulator